MEVGWVPVWVTWRFFNHRGRLGPCVSDVTFFTPKDAGWGPVFVTWHFLHQWSSVEPQCGWNVLQKCKKDVAKILKCCCKNTDVDPPQYIVKPHDRIRTVSTIDQQYPIQVECRRPKPRRWEHIKMYPPDCILALRSCLALPPVGRLWPSSVKLQVLHLHTGEGLTTYCGHFTACGLTWGSKCK